VRIALDQQPAIVAARASLAAAETQRRALEQLPSIPLLTARELAIRRQQAGLGVTIASAALTQIEWETIYAVTRTYFSVLYAREQQRVTDDVVTNLQFYFERVSEIVKKGESRELTTSSVDKIRVYLGLAQGRQAEAVRGLGRALAALREAMGMGQDCPLTIADDRLPDAQTDVQRCEILALALARRGELVQVTAAAEVVRLEVCAQMATHSLTTQTFAAFTDIHARPVPQGISNGEYRPGALGLEMPTNLSGHRSMRVERVRDLSVRTMAVVDKTHNLVALEAVDAFFRWEETAGRVGQTRDAAVAGARLAKNTREDFRGEQKVRIDEVLTNEVLAAQAQGGYNEALYQHALALAALERVTAGGFHPAFRTAVPTLAPEGDRPEGERGSKTPQ
jgi:outer membrane protein TolC